MKYAHIASILVLILSACGREEIQTYQVPKEKPAGSVPAMQASSAPKTHAGFTVALPEGWTEKPGSGMRIASYSIEGTGIDFYLIALAMGDVSSNVNRWRGQIGLPAASTEEIAKSVETIMVDGRNTKYTELYNAETGKGIIAAIVDLKPKYWYFTAKGSTDELKAHAKDIRTFLISLKVK